MQVLANFSLPYAIARSWLPVAVALGTQVCAPYAYAADDAAVSAFAELETMSDARLSPDGEQLAFLGGIDGRYHISIERFAPEFSRHLVNPGDEFDFDWVRWTDPQRLVFASSWSTKRDLASSGRVRVTVETEESRLFSISNEGQDLTSLIKPEQVKETGSRVARDLPPPQIQDNVVDWLPADPGAILAAVDADFDGYSEVRRIDVTSGDFDIVVGNFAGPLWVTDQEHKVRIGYGTNADDDDLRIRYLDLAGQWRDVSNAPWAVNGFVPLAFTEDPAVAIAIGPGEVGRQVVRELDVESGELLGTVFEHERYDAEGIVFDDWSDLPVGVRYTDDYPRVHYFDDTMSKLFNTVNRALPDTINEIASTSSEHRKVLVLARRPNGLGSYFLWDRDAKSLDLYGETHRRLDGVAVAPAKPVRYPARDGTEIPAYLTLPPGKNGESLPTVVLPHGGPRSRADASYNFLAKFLASRGYAVFEPNFRGSTGYGVAFRDAGNREWGGKMQQDVVDGTRWLVDQGIADKDRICIVGWSYGGYSAAMAAIQTPELFQCSASVNGVMNLPRQIEQNRYYRNGQRWNETIGLGEESARSVSPFHRAEEIGIPILLIHSVDDARVEVIQARQMAERLEKLDRPVEYLELEFGGHELRNVEARSQILLAVDRFLESHIGE